MTDKLNDIYKQMTEDWKAQGTANKQAKVADLNMQTAQLKTKQAGIAKQKASLVEQTPPDAGKTLAQILKLQTQILAELGAIRRALQG